MKNFKSHTEKVLYEIEHIPEEHVHHDPNGERWLVSYADMMTLLFGFFALLYALADEPQALQKTLAQAMQTDSKLTAAKPVEPESEALKPKIDLTGNWLGFYKTNSGFMKQEVIVTQKGDEFIAIKLNGDKNVPAGEITWKANIVNLKGYLQIADVGFKNQSWLGMQIEVNSPSKIVIRFEKKFLFVDTMTFERK